MRKAYLFATLFFGLIIFFGAFYWSPHFAEALNIKTFSDTLSDSNPGSYSNHTFKFTLLQTVPSGSYFEFIPPADFSVIDATTTFSTKNVEMYVNGIRRNSGASLAAGVDQVVINGGTPGSIRYNLNPSTGIPANAQIKFLIGNNTSLSEDGTRVEVVEVNGSSSTTTVPADVPGILNSSATGTQKFFMKVVGAAHEIYTDFIIFLVDKINAGPVDTTELIPPVRFNGFPNQNISGTTLNIEMSLNTDEFAECRYSETAGVDYASMPYSFNSSGLVIHTTIVSVVPGTAYVFYVRCIDDEGNFNIDDYLIAFSVNDAPTGQPNAEGEVEGDGTGTGNDGTGTGAGGGGQLGGEDGEASTEGSSSGGGGAGGGGGGGGGSETSAPNPGGGFENSGPYESGDGKVIIRGLAFPSSEVTILVDGQIADRTKAKSDGSFSVTLDRIARGAYTFGIYATDENKVKSSTYSTSFTVSGARASALSNINIPPSVKVDPDPVSVGGVATFSGYAQPNANIEIQSRKENSDVSLKSLTATSSNTGFWSATLNTSGSGQGTYQVRAKSNTVSDGSSNFSAWTYFGIGQSATVPGGPDLNKDGAVNLTDFSILLFWWGTDGGAIGADINGDKTVSLTDFSIMLFNWTG